MAAVVSLKEVVEEMDMIGEDYSAFLNLKTGELYGTTSEQISQAEERDDDELLDWEVEGIEKLGEILNSPDWLKLPERHSHDDYRIMERFCLDKCENPLQEKLLSAISGRGAFGRFKQAIHREGIQESWYAFRREWLSEEAAGWLELKGIEYKE
jgi:hypothetical protein